MGLEFGNLARIVGITYYSISPYEQRAFKGLINPGLKHAFRRFRESFWLFAPPLLVTYTVIQVGNDLHDKYARKNPEDYVNDV